MAAVNFTVAFFHIPIPSTKTTKRIFMELSDKKLNTFQKGILQKYFSLATYGFCIIATASAIAFLIKKDILKTLTAIQKQAGLSEQFFLMLTSALDERGFALASIIIFSSGLLALVSWFIVRWAGNRNWSTPVVLPTQWSSVPRWTGSVS